jgi:hypothetical protein
LEFVIRYILQIPIQKEVNVGLLGGMAKGLQSPFIPERERGCFKRRIS